MEKVGREGVITCETGKSMENEIVVIEGMKFNQGYLSPLLSGRSAKEVVCFFPETIPILHRNLVIVTCLQ